MRLVLILVCLVSGAIGLVSTLSYLELSDATRKNVAVRIDRAARAAEIILEHGSNHRLVRDTTTDPRVSVLTLAEGTDIDFLTPAPAFDRALDDIAGVNMGAANLFRWNLATRSFDRFATTFRPVEDGQPLPFSITRSHPAYANLSVGLPFTGNVPVKGRLRLAHLTPIVNATGDLAGALAVDVGWTDDLTAAQARLTRRIFIAAGLLLVAMLILGTLSLRREMRPLKRLARIADNMALGNKPEAIPYSERKDEIGDLAHGLGRVLDLQDRLHKLAYTDPITTAGNRTRYFSDLNDILGKTRNKDCCATLMHLDFDSFAKVNDIYGQQVGNRVLLQAYRRLATALDPSARISRISADDFCILLPGDCTDARAEASARTALAALSDPFRVGEGEIRIEPRIGIAIIPTDAADAETAHRVAGLALRAAKERSAPRFEFYTAPLNDRLQKEMLIEGLLRAALKTRQMRLHYQPQICPRTGELTGVEALIRWPHESRGFIPPSEFIPIAEKNNLIIDLGDFVLDAACAQAAAWLRDGFDFKHIAINVSPIQFRQPNFARSVRRALEKYGLMPSMLCLEVTETVFVDTREDMVRSILEEIEAIGVSLSLDDFGSGYSSLSYLHGLPFRQFKIDRSFLREADIDPKKRKLFDGIVGLGKSLGLHVVAEGAETEGEVALTARLGCDAVQGFYFAPALPAAELQEFAAAKGVLVCTKARALRGTGN